MALYSFIEDAGKKISEMGELGAPKAAETAEKPKLSMRKTNTAASEKLKEIIYNYDLEVQDLSILIESNTANISGKATDQATREKIILAVGNIQGISQVNESLTCGDEEPEAKFHTVTTSDSLESIAEKLYGDSKKAKLILEANHPLVTEENKIYVGQVLRITELVKN